VNSTNGNNSFSPLAAISPLDGRYHKDTTALYPYLSEFALIKFRLAVEILFLISLSDEKIVRKISTKEKALLENIVTSFTISYAENIKEKEKITQHDVKAMELFLREKLARTSLKDILEMIHFGITSEDVNNLSIRMMIRNSINDVLLPELQSIVKELKKIAGDEKATVILARTHGQNAVPTTLGKEIAVFVARLEKELSLLATFKLSGKIGGASGNLNALAFAFPKTNWQKFSKKMVESLDFTWNPTVIQIHPYDDIIAYFQIVQRVNNILLNFSQDMWRYISDGWFMQEVKKGEVGSSTMPQKVNPIFFENAEGNLGIANSLIDFFTRKLSVTRLQRDLSDSTVARNFGTTLGYSLLAYQSLLKGVGRIKPNRELLKQSLEEDWSVLTEAAQTLLRLENVENAYMLVKELSRGKKVDKSGWEAWVTTLPLSNGSKKRLLSLTPETYIGLAIPITEGVIKKT
jgi:adenylosuccinate lyase